MTDDLGLGSLAYKKLVEELGLPMTTASNTTPTPTRTPLPTPSSNSNPSHPWPMNPNHHTTNNTPTTPSHHLSLGSLPSTPTAEQQQNYLRAHALRFQPSM